MTDPAPPAIRARVADHSLFILYPFHIALSEPKDGLNPEDQPLPSPALRLAEVIDAPWQAKLTAALQKKAEQRLAEVTQKHPSRDSEHAGRNRNQAAPTNDNIWEESDWPIAPDMDTQVARLLAQPKDGGKQATSGVPLKIWTLSRQNNVRDALKGSVGLARHLDPRLVIKFSPAAVKRMSASAGSEAPNTMTVEIGTVRALAFQTGQGMLVAELRFTPPASGTLTTAMLVEAVVALCADRHLSWVDRDGDELPASSTEHRVRLRIMLRALLGRFAVRETTSYRFFTYTYARLDAAIGPLERQRLMIQLACKYTDDYRINPSAFDGRIYQPFQSVSHLAALEGATTIVEDVAFEDRDAPNFLTDFGANAIERRYLPVVVVAYHAFVALLDLTQDTRSWINLRAPTSEEAARLHSLRDRILEFRLFHRLTYVSLLTMPNELYGALARAFAIERMLTNADRDVTEISTVLDTRVRQAEARRSTWFRRLTAASLAVISGSFIGKVIVETLTSSGWHLVGHLVELGFAVLFGGAAWWWSERGGGGDHAQQEVAAHLGHEAKFGP